MGWWKQGDDLLGDGPVDLFEEGLQEFVNEHRKPDWPSFLNALAASLGAGEVLRAQFEDSKAHLTSESGRAEPSLTDALSDIVRQIKEEYQDYTDRQPTPSEIVGTVNFSLGVRPDRFLSSEGPMPDLKRLSVEARG